MRVHSEGTLKKILEKSTYKIIFNFFLGGGELWKRFHGIRETELKKLKEKTREFLVNFVKYFTKVLENFNKDLWRCCRKIVQFSELKNKKVEAN